MSKKITESILRDIFLLFNTSFKYRTHLFIGEQLFRILRNKICVLERNGNSHEHYAKSYGQGFLQISG